MEASLGWSNQALLRIARGAGDDIYTCAPIRHYSNEKVFEREHSLTFIDIPAKIRQRLSLNTITGPMPNQPSSCLR